jgi:hypothetical protein
VPPVIVPMFKSPMLRVPAVRSSYDSKVPTGSKFLRLQSSYWFKVRTGYSVSKMLGESLYISKFLFVQSSYRLGYVRLGWRRLDYVRLGWCRLG